MKSGSRATGATPAPAPRRWVPRPDLAPAPEEEVDALARAIDVPPVVARLLIQRGHPTPARARRFLSPKLADLAPPEGWPGLDAATERLARALHEGERLAICGDYDVDGMTGTALLVRFFELLDADVQWAIPDRALDGYGLSARMVEVLAEAGVDVAITVDNGVSAHEALVRAEALGIDVIVTDHHLPGADLPPAVAIVNPHLGEGDEDAAPCGCALAFKLAWAVADRIRGRLQGERMDRFRQFLRDGVALSAMASVTDAVPLVGENRTLVSAGLGALRRSPHPGLQALLRVSEVGRLPITAEDVGFRLGPRLNAAGRLGQPELVVELLTSDDPARCQTLAETLDRLNQERKEIENGVKEAALTQATALLEAGPRVSLVVAGEGWHAGVIGIVAARLVDRFGLPSVVIGLDGDRGRGSGRTPVGVDLHAAFDVASESLERHGGHAMAAGLEIQADRVATFRDAFEAAVSDQVGADAPGPAVHVDMECDVDAWHLGAVEALRRMAPFGSRNPEPVIVVRHAEVAGKPRLMGRDSSHLSFALKQTGGAIRVVAFRRADLHDVVASGQPLDLAVVPVVNEWRGKRTAEFRLVDLRPATRDPDTP